MVAPPPEPLVRGLLRPSTREQGIGLERANLISEKIMTSFEKLCIPFQFVAWVAYQSHMGVEVSAFRKGKQGF